jgi:hypothetical protein
VLWGTALLFLSGAFFWYPTAIVLRAVFSDEMRVSAQPPDLLQDLDAAAARYGSWAAHYLETRRAASLDSEDVAGTEWPMFGSVLFLLAAEALTQSHGTPLTDTTREALHLAADVVADPTTATWVRAKWGAAYLERENVFYRMLLLLGLSTYESLTGDTRHASTLRTQTGSLTRELLAAPLHLADDYPGQCYPSDVLWAVAALKRATALGHGSRDEVERLARGVLAVLDGPANGAGPSGIPGRRRNRDPAPARARLRQLRHSRHGRGAGCRAGRTLVHALHRAVLERRLAARIPRGAARNVGLRGRGFGSRAARRRQRLRRRSRPAASVGSTMPRPSACRPSPRRGRLRSVP